jgi:hypothetical protein
MPTAAVQDSIESLARVIPWDKVSTRLVRTIRESNKNDLVEEACRRNNSGRSNTPGPSRIPNDAFTKEMRMTVNAVMSFMASCRNSTIPVSIVQRYKDLSESFGNGLARAVSGNNNSGVMTHLRSFRAEIQNLTSECQIYVPSRTIYQKAVSGIIYILAFVNLNYLFMSAWSYFHARAFDSGMMMHAQASLIYESAKEIFNSPRWAKWILNVVTLGTYSVSPRGIVTKSDIAYDYVKMYNELKGLYLDRVSKIVYQMIRYTIQFAVPCSQAAVGASKTALEVFAKILEPKNVVLKPVHKMFVILFIVSSSIAMLRTVVRRRQTIVNTVFRKLPMTVADLSSRIYSMVTSMPSLKRKRALNPMVNVHRAMQMAGRSVAAKRQRASPTRYFNAVSNSNNNFVNAASNTNNNYRNAASNSSSNRSSNSNSNRSSNSESNEYYNAVNHATVDEVASMFGRLSLTNR